MDARDDVSVSLASEAGFSDDGVPLSPWVLEVGAQQQLGVARDRDVEGHPCYAVRVRVGDFAWTVSLLRFARLQAFEARVRRAGGGPDDGRFPHARRRRRESVPRDII